jgi:hypothetical protein
MGRKRRSCDDDGVGYEICHTWIFIKIEILDCRLVELVCGQRKFQSDKIQNERGLFTLYFSLCTVER